VTKLGEQLNALGVPEAGLLVIGLKAGKGTNLAINCDTPDNYRRRPIMTPTTPSYDSIPSKTWPSLAARAGRCVRNSSVLSALLAVVLFAVGSASLNGATYSSNGSVADIQSKHNSAADGDTITIPAGTFTWSVQLNITKAITLQGSGVGNTIIKDAGSAGLINWYLVAGKPSRMTGIEFRDGGRTVANWGVQTFGSNTNGSTMRMDHCKFDHLVGFAVTPNDTIGVFDHNTCLNGPNSTIYAFDKNWNNQGPYAGGSWADSSHFGSSQFFFIEDNSFILDAPYAVIDCYAGARWVFRHNTVTRGHLEVHGTESGIFRGGRAFEVYGNTFNGPTLGNYIVNGRSGIFVVHDNQTTGISAPKVNLANYRTEQPDAPWGQVGGTSLWDVNDVSDHTGNGSGGGANGLYATGTATSGTANGGAFNYPTMTVTGATWAPNVWVGYSLHKNSPGASPPEQPASFIFANTKDTITYLPPLNAWNGNNGFVQMSFSNGTGFTIYRPLHGMDQPGRSQGALILDGNNPPPSGGINQVTEPCYEWNNTMTEGGSFHLTASPYDTLIRSNEHYFNSTVKPGYTPFTYPHPLTTGTAQPNPPSNLRVSSP
jgi:hypothetical protein